MFVLITCFFLYSLNGKESGILAFLSSITKFLINSSSHNFYKRVLLQTLILIHKKKFGYIVLKKIFITASFIKLFKSRNVEF